MATGISITPGLSVCYDLNSIHLANGAIYENSDGTVSMFLPDSNGVLIPIALGMKCCKAIKSTYIFDIDKQECRWSDSSCNLIDPIKLVLNSNGDDGTLFTIEGNQNCFLDIEFDYLFKYKCETLVDILNSTTPLLCSEPIDSFESLDVSITLEAILSGNSMETVYEEILFSKIGSGNLYTYLVENINSGFYVCGDPTPSEIGFNNCTPLSMNISSTTEVNVYSCNTIMNNLIQELYLQSGLSGVTNGNNIFASKIQSNSLKSIWKHGKITINDVNVINNILNKKIKLSVKINDGCSDFCVLLDNIQMNKVCTESSNEVLFLSKSPGFTITKLPDNKKSWVSKTTKDIREFNITNYEKTNLIRETNYDVDNYKLIINSKEIDLDVSIAAGIETDVWSYIIDNPQILTGITNCNSCLSACIGDNKIDFNQLLTQSLTAVTTVDDFEYFLRSELIDVKNRQTIHSYPTLRALYDRYMNSSLYYLPNSSRFDYLSMDQFSRLLGNYWIDIVEQVVPATTMWGSVKVYSNTIFDQQKFKYKSYSTLFSFNSFQDEKILSPINGTSGLCSSVDVIITRITIEDNGIEVFSSPTLFDNICIAQMNFNSEFIGSLGVAGISPISNEDPFKNGGVVLIQEQ